MALLSDIHTGKGGTERFTCRLANVMTQRGHGVTIFSLNDYKEGTPPVFNLEPDIQVRRVPCAYDHASVRRLREAIRVLAPDACVGFASSGRHLFWSVATLGSEAPYVYSEQTAPERIERLWNRSGRLAAMSGADAVHLLVPEYAASVPDFLRDRVRCIPNPAPPAPEKKCSDSPLTLLSLGRLHPVKQIPLLVEAFLLLAEEFPNWRLDIYGAGEDEAAVRASVAAGDARRRIRLCGETDAPLEAFQRAAIFCIPSLYEGLPTTVVEAMACGVPVVGFAGCSGVNSVVRDNVTGCLASDMSADSLAETLGRLMRDASLRQTLAANALEAAKEYAADKIFDEWEALFFSMAKIRGRTRMDAFFEEPFASMARLSSAARREWVYRDFGAPWPGTWAYYRGRLKQAALRCARRICLRLPRFFG